MANTDAISFVRTCPVDMRIPDIVEAAQREGYDVTPRIVLALRVAQTRAIHRDTSAAPPRHMPVDSQLFPFSPSTQKDDAMNTNAINGTPQMTIPDSGTTARRKVPDPLAGCSLVERVGHEPSPHVRFILSQPLDMHWMRVIELGKESGFKLDRAEVWKARWQATHPKRLGYPPLTESAAIVDMLPRNTSADEALEILKAAGIEITKRGLSTILRGVAARRKNPPKILKTSRPRKAPSDLPAFVRQLSDDQLALPGPELVKLARGAGFKSQPPRTIGDVAWRERKLRAKLPGERQRNAAAAPAAAPASGAVLDHELVFRRAIAHVGLVRAKEIMREINAVLGGEALV